MWSKNTHERKDFKLGIYLGLLVLRIVLSVDMAGWRLVRDAQRGVVHLHRLVVLEVKETCLTDVALGCLVLSVAPRRR